MPAKTLVAMAMFLVVAGSAVAGQQMPTVVTAEDGVRLRSAPDGQANLVRRLPVLTSVVILKRGAQMIDDAGRKDRWIYVQADYCPDPADKSPYCETLIQRGWLPDSRLAYDSRLAPVEEWPAGRIEGQIGNDHWSYDLSTDGDFTLTRESWSYRGLGADCPAAQRKGDYCMRTSFESGRLYRYRNVVRAGKNGEYLFVDGRGALCDRRSTPAQRFCDR